MANGLLVGAYYIVLALGLSLIFSLGGVVNLAHGAFYALGAYLAYEIQRRLGFAGAMALSPIGVALIGVVIERLAIRRFYREDPGLALLFTFGLAMAAEQSLRLVWGATGLPFGIPEALRGQVFLGDFIYSRYRMAVLAVSAAAVTGCWLLLNKTSFGLVVRAGTRDAEMVRALGIALGVGLAGLAGVMSAPLAGVHPAMGTEILVAAFVIVVIGGLGSFWGVVWAGLIVGVVRGLTVLFYPPAAEASMYALMVLVLLVRPRGLMGERFERFVTLSAAVTGLGGCLFAFLQSIRLGRPGPRGLLGGDRGDDHRGWHGPFPRPRTRQRLLHPLPRAALGTHGLLAVLVRAHVHGLHPLLALGAHRPWGTPPSPLPTPGRGGRRHGRAPHAAAGRRSARLLAWRDAGSGRHPRMPRGDQALRRLHGGGRRG